MAVVVVIAAVGMMGGNTGSASSKHKRSEQVTLSTCHKLQDSMHCAVRNPGITTPITANKVP